LLVEGRCGFLQERGFWKRARKNRFRVDTILATKMDFNAHSNSKTIELLFQKGGVKLAKQKPVVISSINFSDPDQKQECEKDGCMLDFK
jgi:hypothetical protein